MEKCETDKVVVETVGLVAVLVGLGIAGAFVLAVLTNKIDGWVALGYVLFGLALALVGKKMVDAFDES